MPPTHYEAFLFKTLPTCRECFQRGPKEVQCLVQRYLDGRLWRKLQAAIPKATQPEATQLEAIQPVQALWVQDTQSVLQVQDTQSVLHFDSQNWGPNPEHFKGGQTLDKRLYSLHHFNPLIQQHNEKHTISAQNAPSWVHWWRCTYD